MEYGARITVVYGGKLVHGHALKLSDGWWWMANSAEPDTTRVSGPLGEEDIHYVRGFLRTWWPPHRKRGAALVVAAALGPSLPLAEPTLSAHTAIHLMKAMMHGMNTDVAKLIGDARRITERAERRATGYRIKRLTRRWP